MCQAQQLARARQSPVLACCCCVFAWDTVPLTLAIDCIIKGWLFISIQLVEHFGCLLALLKANSWAYILRKVWHISLPTFSCLRVSVIFGNSFRRTSIFLLRYHTWYPGQPWGLIYWAMNALALQDCPCQTFYSLQAIVNWLLIYPCWHITLSVCNIICFVRLLSVQFTLLLMINTYWLSLTRMLRQLPAAAPINLKYLAH